jgi:hypothetical protein
MFLNDRFICNLELNCITGILSLIYAASDLLITHLEESKNAEDEHD